MQIKLRINSENGGRRQRKNKTQKKTIAKEETRRFYKVISACVTPTVHNHVTILHQPMKLTAKYSNLIQI